MYKRVFNVSGKPFDTGLTVRNTITFLEYKISKSDIQIPNETIEIIYKVQVPKNVKIVKAILSLENYYGKLLIIYMP